MITKKPQGPSGPNTKSLLAPKPSLTNSKPQSLARYTAGNALTHLSSWSGRAAGPVSPSTAAGPENLMKSSVSHVSPNTGARMPSHPQVGQRQNRPQAARPRPDISMQTKMIATAQMKKAPVAPPVYRPRSVAKIAQMKVSAPLQTQSLNRCATAPAVYRPQAMPTCLQLKSQQTQVHKTQARPHTPVARRPVSKPFHPGYPASAETVRQSNTSVAPASSFLTQKLTGVQMKTGRVPAVASPRQLSNLTRANQVKTSFAPSRRIRAQIGAEADRFSSALTSPASAAAIMQMKTVGATGRKRIIQRKPTNNNDPTNQTDGTYFDREDKEKVGGYSVPERITAIMKNPTRGGTPSVNPPGWSWLRKKIGRLKGQWVRFHIISDRLGGPGDKKWNLVPTSYAVNSSFFQNIEKYAIANSKTKWTYVDVELEYDITWPAPIPKRIRGEWGAWDSTSNRWVKKNSTVLDNPDIEELDEGFIYLRGTNITQDQVKRRRVPTGQVRAFTRWLQNYWQKIPSETLFFSRAENEFGEDFDAKWLSQMWLDEAKDGKGYEVVVKPL